MLLRGNFANTVVLILSKIVRIATISVIIMIASIVILMIAVMIVIYLTFGNFEKDKR